MPKMNIGYIVYDNITGNVVSLLKRDNKIWKNVPAEGVLLSDSREATVFLTRIEALTAIMRTIILGQLHGQNCKWESDHYTLMRLVPNTPEFRNGKHCGRSS